MAVNSNGKAPENGYAIGAGLDVIATLRSVPGLSSTLQIAGGALIFVGTGWGASRFLQEHPYVFLVLLGVMFMMVSLVACRDGLLSFLSADTQEFLTNKTFWDFWYDDSGLHNTARKWGRILLLSLQDGQSERTVRTLVKDLDPAFVDGLLQAPWVEYLPPAAQRVLLPEADAAMTAKSSGVAAAQRHVNGTVSVQPAKKKRELLTTPAIAKLLRDKFAEKNARVTETELMPVVVKAMAIEPAIASAAQSAVRGAQAAAAAATVWFGASALVLHRDFVQGVLVRGLASVGIMRGAASSQIHDWQVSKPARITAALGCLSAGAYVAVSMFYKRVATKWDTEIIRRPED